MPRTVPLDILERIEIASPCPMKWEDMEGDDRTRFCRECSLHVHNIAALTRAEAIDLITRTEGRLCGAIYRRADGTILTRDCPVGLAAVRARTVAAVRRIAAAVALVLGAGITLGLGKEHATRLRQAEPFATVCRWLSPPPPPMPVPGGIAIRGEIYVGKVAAPAPNSPVGANTLPAPTNK